jgi:uncharacterized peroxidase-related enzyme
MSRLTLHTADTAPAASRPFIDKALANNGFLPNLIAVLSNSPQAVETYFTVGGINGSASLTLAEREVVQITAARTHGCDFCVAGHTAVALNKADMPSDQVCSLQFGDDTGEPRLDAIARFTRAVIASRGAVGDDVLQDFRAAGFGDQQALEVVLGVSLATLCNFANNLARTPINEPLKAYLPGALPR